MNTILDYDCILVDLDGTVYKGGRAIEHAIPAINECEVPIRYITNNASRAPEAVAEQLQAIGLKGVSRESVLTSAQAAIRLALAQIPQGSRVLILGSDSFRSLAASAGFIVVDSADEHPAAVLQGHNPGTGWAQLSEAALAIRDGALYFASNTDTTLPMERGLYVGNGSMVAAVTSATGVVPTSAGKPKPDMFFTAAQELGSQRPLVIGDRLDTDIAGGNNAGFDTFQVLTGVSGFYDLVNAAPAERPTFIAESMSSLHQDFSELKPSFQGGFTVHSDGSTLVLKDGDRSASPIQALRTVLSHVWQQSDSYVDSIRGGSKQAELVLQSWW